jgi:hypothetical protein
VDLADGNRVSGGFVPALAQNPALFTARILPDVNKHWRGLITSDFRGKFSANNVIVTFLKKYLVTTTGSV